MRKKREEVRVSKRIQRERAVLEANRCERDLRWRRAGMRYSTEKEGEGNPSVKLTLLTPGFDVRSLSCISLLHQTLYGILNRQIRSGRIRVLDMNINLARAPNRLYY